MSGPDGCLYISKVPIWPFKTTGDAIPNKAEEECSKFGLSLLDLTDPNSPEAIALKEISSKKIVYINQFSHVHTYMYM